jgi:hypothetical protein
MRFQTILISFILLFCVSSFAQTPAPSPVSTFSVVSTAISLPNGKTSVVGNDSGFTFTPTDNLDLKYETILASGLDFQGAGFNYRFPVLSTKLQNVSSTVNGYRFRFYLTGSAGIVRAPFNGVTVQHYGFLGGFGVSYDLNQSGRFTLGGEVRYAKLPHYNNNTAIVEFGPAVHF